MKDDALHHDEWEESAHDGHADSSDLEPFLMTVEELETQHASHLRYRRNVELTRWMKRTA